MFRKIVIVAALILFGSKIPSGAQTAPGKDNSTSPKEASPSASKLGDIDSRVEKYLRNLYAWGSDFEVKLGPSKTSPLADLLEVPVTVSMGKQSDTAVVYVSKDGRFLFRGELADMSADPFADMRSKLHPEKSPSMGPADAQITLVEFADFECPSCRQLDLVLRDLLSNHHEIRLVFKHFPLTDLHPWAMTAAIASQCAFQQSPSAFWKMHDAIFDAQDVISPSNVWDKMMDLGTQLQLNQDAYKACMISPDTANQVKETMEEGHSVNITATPTTFINGRRVVGPDKSTIERYLKFEHPS